MHFDATVTLGNVLTIAAFAIAAIAYGMRVDNDLKNIKSWIAGHKLCNDKQISILDEVRSSLSYLRGVHDGKTETDKAHAPHLKDRYS